MNCTSMIGSLSISDDVSFYLPENRLFSHYRIIVFFFFHALPLTSTPRSLYGFTAKGIRHPMFVKHEDGLGFVSLRPL